MPVARQNHQQAQVHDAYECRKYSDGDDCGAKHVGSLSTR